ncbi:MAG: hypothetical protein AAF382_13455 [Pseudomonadota bacterium]
MISARRILTIVGTLFTALAAGFMMQYIMDAPDERGAQGVQVASVAGVATQPLTDAVVENDILAQTPTLDEAEAPGRAKNAEGATAEPVETQAAAKTINFSGDAPTPPGFAPQPETLPNEPVTVASLDDAPVNSILPREEPAPSFACDTKAVAITSAAAMVDLIIDANCHKSAGFTVHHNGMMVSGMTDADGLASVMLPALTEKAVFMVTFTGGETVVANAEVTSVQDYDRAIVQWSAFDGLQVHALEYGATYEEPGHVWSGAMGELATAAKGEGGFMMRMGEPTPLSTHMIEVYTFPTGTALNEGSIELSLEAVVTEANCGRDLEAQVLQKSGAEPMRARDLILAMPDCDAVGDFLVLKNMFDDLNIARN